MRNTLLLAAALLPLAATAQQTNKVEKQLDNWTRESYYVLQTNKSVKHGPYLKELTGRRRQPLQQGFYKQGRRDSTWVEYGWNGRVQGTGPYREDEKAGVWRYYSTGGDTLLQEYNYATRQLQFAFVQPALQTRQYTVVQGTQTKQTTLDRPVLYLGTNMAMYHIIGPQIRYPAGALRAQVQGKVWIEFVVDEQGRASGHRVKSGIGSGCDEEALRVAKLIPDNWLPAMLNNQPVAAMHELPFTFAIK
jgi:protein TonB